MYVNRERKFALIHIPKTGGAFIVNNILRPIGVKRVGGRPKHHFYKPEFVEDDWFIFAFIRNPYERAASLYRHHCIRNKGRKTNKGISSFFIRLAKECKQDNKPLTQFDALDPRVELFRFEDFDKEVKRICDRLKVDVPDMSKAFTNHYFGEYDWRQWVKKEDMQTVNRLFKEDFERLGYEMWVD